MLILETYRILGAEGILTTAYHPRTNGKTGRFNRTILSALRKHCAEHPKDWDRHSHLLTFAYISQIHEYIGVAPLDLVLSRPLVMFQLGNLPRKKFPRNQKEAERQWLQHLKRLAENHVDQCRFANGVIRKLSIRIFSLGCR